MPRKHHRPRSDSIEAQTATAQTPDTSALPIPRIAGDEMLGEIGRDYLASIWRSDPGRFSAADLAMLVEASYTFEALHNNRMLCIMEPIVVTLSNGMQARISVAE